MALAKKQLELTSRGWAQGALEAMGGQIDRGLVELITNSDDAYAGRDGKIDIIIDLPDGSTTLNPLDGEYVLEIRVVDRAGGIAADQLIEKLTKIGGATSLLSQGGESRGFLGRGAKDVAIFGAIVFQSVRGGEIAELVIDSEGSFEEEIRRAPVAGLNVDEHGLGAGEAGLIARIFVSEGMAKTVPDFNKLFHTLRNEAQLRNLLGRRQVWLDDRRNGKKAQVVPDLESGELISEHDVTLEGYPSGVGLKIFRLPSKQNGEASSGTAHGLLVSCGTSSFQNSWFRWGKEVSSGWLRGELELRDAVSVIRSEIDKSDASGDLIKPNRSGLNLDHPYMKAVLNAIAPIVNVALDDAKKLDTSEKRQGDSLRQASRLASAAIGRILKNFLEDLDEEPFSGTEDSELALFDVIPPVRHIEPGKKGTITLRASEDLVADHPVEARLVNPADPPSGFVASLGELDDLVWKRHERVDRLITQWRFSAPPVPTEMLVEFLLGTEKRSLRIVCEENLGTELPEVTYLEFLHQSVSFAPKKTRKLVILAPLEEAGNTISIMVHEEGILKLASERATLQPSSRGNVCVATFPAESTGPLGRVSVTAKSISGATATCVVEVKESTQPNLFEPQFDLKYEPRPSSRANIFESANQPQSVIYPNHPSFNGIFGEYDESEKKGSREDSPEVRALIAQVHSEQIARYMTEKELEKRPYLYPDPAAAVARFFGHLESIVGVLEKALRVQPDE